MIFRPGWTRAACDAVIDDLAEALSRHRFGAVLAALMVDQDEIEEHIARVPAHIRIGAAVSRASGAAPGPAGELAGGLAGGGGATGGLAQPGLARSGLARPGQARPGTARLAIARPGTARAEVTGAEVTGLERTGLERTGLERTGRGTADPGAALAAGALPQPGPAVRSMTQGDFQAETALSLWIDRVKRFCDDAALRQAYGLRPQSEADLVAELIQAARRTGLAPRIAAQLAEIGFGMTVERQAAPAAILAAERINDFVTTLGMSALPEARRPKVSAEGRPDRPVFAAKPDRDTLAGLPQIPRPIAPEVWEDWVFALDALVQANASQGIGGEIDLAQNLHLGRSLDGIRSGARP